MEWRDIHIEVDGSLIVSFSQWKKPGQMAGLFISPSNEVNVGFE